ncbi:MAG: proteasome accessory factor [Actinomycetota bacterium]|jgi:predicted DNA-binding transcriptional regulator YafY|nr:proteasome accessory factor [Actinomycetota bacterium]
MPKNPGRDQTPGMERMVRLITILNGSEFGAPAERMLDALLADDASDEAKRKMLDRDIGHLNQLGYDIRNVADPGAEGVYRMFARDNRLRVHLTQAQRGELLRAVVASGRDDLAPHLGSDASPAVAPASGSGVTSQLDLAMRAASRHCLIRFTYKGRDRAVHPHGVHSGPSGWYLTGREDDQDVVKEFVVARMTDVTLEEPGSAELVEQSSRPSLDPLSWEQDAPTDVVLELRPEHLPVVTNVLGEPSEITETGEVLRATYRVTHRAVFRWRVYELGTRVRVLSPADVIAEVVQELESMIAGGS